MCKVNTKCLVRYSFKMDQLQLFDEKHINVQQVPEEIERVMVGIEAYLSIRRHVSDIGLSIFEEADKTNKDQGEKVWFMCYPKLLLSTTSLQSRFFLVFLGKEPAKLRRRWE